MRLAYLDSFAGISGDLRPGALIDAGASFQRVREAALLLLLRDRP